MWALDGSEDIGMNLLKTAFVQSDKLEYIIWSSPTSATLPDFILSNFTEINLQDRSSIPSVDPFNGCKLYYIRRKIFLPQLRIRDARVEDNDDLLPILNNSKSYYNDENHDDFFLANLIENQDSLNRFIYIYLLSRYI